MHWGVAGEVAMLLKALRYSVFRIHWAHQSLRAVADASALTGNNGSGLTSFVGSLPAMLTHSVLDSCRAQCNDWWVASAAVGGLQTTAAADTTSSPSPDALLVLENWAGAAASPSPPASPNSEGGGRRVDDALYLFTPTELVTKERAGVSSLSCTLASPAPVARSPLYGGEVGLTDLAGGAAGVSTSTAAAAAAASGNPSDPFASAGFGDAFSSDPFGADLKPAQSAAPRSSAGPPTSRAANSARPTRLQGWDAIVLGVVRRVTAETDSLTVADSTDINIKNTTQLKPCVCIVRYCEVAAASPAASEGMSTKDEAGGKERFTYVFTSYRCAAYWVRYHCTAGAAAGAGAGVGTALFASAAPSAAPTASTASPSSASVPAADQVVVSLLALSSDGTKLHLLGKPSAAGEKQREAEAERLSVLDTWTLGAEMSSVHTAPLGKFSP